jgi:hypothetical protein
MKALTRSKALLYYWTEEEYGGVIDTSEVGIIDFGDLDFANTSFLTSREPQTIPVPSRIRKCIFLTFKIENDDDNFGMGINGMDINYSIGSEVR